MKVWGQHEAAIIRADAEYEPRRPCQRIMRRETHPTGQRAACGARPLGNARRYRRRARVRGVPHRGAPRAVPCPTRCPARVITDMSWRVLHPSSVDRPGAQAPRGASPPAADATGGRVLPVSPPLWARASGERRGNPMLGGGRPVYAGRDFRFDAP